MGISFCKLYQCINSFIPFYTFVELTIFAFNFKRKEKREKRKEKREKRKETTDNRQQITDNRHPK